MQRLPLAQLRRYLRPIHRIYDQPNQAPRIRLPHTRLEYLLNPLSVPLNKAPYRRLPVSYIAPRCFRTAASSSP